MKSYDTFVRDFNASQEAVIKVATYLNREGKQVIIPAHKVRAAHENRDNYRDDGDIFIAKPVQVKHVSLVFRSKEEFPYASVIVDEAYKIDAQVRYPPVGYYIVSHCLTGALYIPWTTNEDWIKWTRFDKAQQRECDYMRCPMELCDYIQF